VTRLTSLLGLPMLRAATFILREIVVARVRDGNGCWALSQTVVFSDANGRRGVPGQAMLEPQNLQGHLDRQLMVRVGSNIEPGQLSDP